MPTDVDPQPPIIPALLQLIRSSPALAEFIDRPVGTPLNDQRRQHLVRRRVELLSPYVSNTDIHEAVRADFSEALSLTERLPEVIADLLSTERTLEEGKIDAPSAMLLAGNVVRRQYEETGSSQIWEHLWAEVLHVLHNAAVSDTAWNAGDLINERFPDRDDSEIATLAVSIMATYHSIRNSQEIRIHVSKLASVYDALFYGGVLNGISGRYHKRLIIDRLEEAVISAVVDQTGLGQIRDLVELLADLFAVDRILSRKADDFATVSKYLRSYLEALRIVGALAVELSDLNLSFLNTYRKILRLDAPDG